VPDKYFPERERNVVAAAFSLRLVRFVCSRCESGGQQKKCASSKMNRLSWHFSSIHFLQISLKAHSFKTHFLQQITSNAN
jgi:predicted metal-binding protein